MLNMLVCRSDFVEPFRLKEAREFLHNNVKN